jgi:hypothetical protein
MLSARIALPQAELGAMQTEFALRHIRAIISPRWERQKVYFDAFIDLATIHIWIQRILLVG